MTRSDRLMCMIPHQCIGSPLSSLFLIRLFGGVQWRGQRESIFVPHILQSQKPDSMEKTSHTIRSRCTCVWNFSGCNSHPFLHDSTFYLGYGLSFLSFLFLFSLFFMLLGMDTFFFLLHSPYLGKIYLSHMRFPVTSSQKRRRGSCSSSPLR